jgi:hypothetical protein
MTRLLKRYWLPLLILAGITLLAFLKLAGGSNAPATATVLPSPDGLPGLLTGNAPWPSNTGQLDQRLHAMKLPLLNSEGTALHIHQHLDIYINGKPVTVPADIGIPDSAAFISPIHVHDTSGVVHIESPTVQPFFLGQVFDVWGVRLTNTSIGGFTTTAGKHLTVYVNGKKYTGDPRRLELSAHQEIAIVYGSKAQDPEPIPASYHFAKGL